MIVLGDDVVLNSGGPVMEVVARLRNGEVSVIWHLLDGPHEHIFHPDMLTKLKFDPPPFKGYLEDGPPDPSDWWNPPERPLA